MEFEKINAPTLKELFITQLENKILSGTLSIGDKLPSERELCDSMGVSRAVVNSGISELARKGFLTVRPRVGTFVADYRREGTMETLTAIMNYNGGILRPDEVRSILELRIALNTIASELCIKNCSDDEIVHLRNLADKIAASTTAEEAVNSSFAFQHTFAVLSNNTLIPLIITSFRQPFSTLWRRYYTLYGVNSLYHNVAILCDFLEKRDTNGAREWLRSSIEMTIKGSTQIYF